MSSIKQTNKKKFLFFFFSLKCQKSSKVPWKHIWIKRSEIWLLIVLYTQVLCCHFVLMYGPLISKEGMSMSIQPLILLSFPHLGTNDQNDQNWQVTGISKTEHLSLKNVIVFSLQAGFSQTHQNLILSKCNTFQTLLLVLYSAYSKAFLCIKRMIRQAGASTWTETLYI